MGIASQVAITAQDRPPQGDASLERTLHFEVADVIVARFRPRLKSSDSLLVTVPGGEMLLRGNGLPADGVRVRTNFGPRYQEGELHLLFLRTARTAGALEAVTDRYGSRTAAPWVPGPTMCYTTSR